MENQRNSNVLLLMSFKKTKNHGRFNVPHRYILDIFKIGVVWPSVFDVTSIRCTFTKKFCFTFIFGDYAAFKNSYTKRYLCSDLICLQSQWFSVIL